MAEEEKRGEGIMQVDQARSILQAQRAERVAKCAEAVSSALREFGCTLGVSLEISEDGRIVGRPVIGVDD